MNAYKINNGQKTSIENQKFSDATFFNPVKDINGHWFIFEIEMNYCVAAMGWARATLTTYVPPQSNEFP